MAIKDYDRWLWLGLGVFLVLAAKAVQHELWVVVTPRQICVPQENSNELKKKPCEDDIPLNVLAILSTSPNYDIREAAMKIICTRFTSSSYRVHSLYDNVSPSSSLSPSEILAAQEALSLLRHYELIIENITRPPSAIDTAEVLEPNVREAEAWVRWQRREAMVLGGEDGSVQVLRPSTLQDGSLGRMAEAGMVREDPAEMEEFLSQLNGE